MLEPKRSQWWDNRLRDVWRGRSLPSDGTVVVRSPRVVRAAMTARQFPSPWYAQEMDGWSLQNTADTREWIGSVSLFALVTLILLAFAFV